MSLNQKKYASLTYEVELFAEIKKLRRMIEENRSVKILRRRYI